jgi:hypothetical protein
MVIFLNPVKNNSCLTQKKSNYTKTNIKKIHFSSNSDANKSSVTEITEESQIYSTEMGNPSEMYPEISREIAKSEVDFYNALVKYVPLSGYEPPAANTPENILDVGVGSTQEFWIINSYFGNKNFGFIDKNTCVYVIDNNEFYIDCAKLLMGKRNLETNPQIKLFKDDVREVNIKSDQYPKQFGVVIFRNPNFQFSQGNLEIMNILAAGFNLLRPGGIMIITGDSHELVNITLGLNNLRNERNDFKITVPERRNTASKVNLRENFQNLFKMNRDINIIIAKKTE